MHGCRQSAGKTVQRGKRSGGSWPASSREKAVSASPSRRHPTTKSGFYVDPEFFVYQHKNRRALLELFR